MARGPIFPDDNTEETRRAEREKDALFTARLKERTLRIPDGTKWPFFVSKVERDAYLDKLITNGYQVKARVVHNVKANRLYVMDIGLREGIETFDILYTVESIDRRKGK